MTTRDARAHEDVGLFGPDTVTWRIHADPSMVVGGIRALLIQALNPLAMAAVEQSKVFQVDPWGQLERTVNYVLTTTYGDTRSALAAGARVRAVHSRVRGIDDVTGLPYSADDPALLLWVHCAEVDSFLVAYRAYGGKLSDEDADRYAGEMVKAAELVGLSRGAVPDTAKDLRDYLDRARMLCVTPAAREGLTFLLAAPIPLPRQVLWKISVAAAIAILPRRIRELYGLPWFERADPLVRFPVFSLYRAINVLFPRPRLVREALASGRGQPQTYPKPATV
jgi:uncharacterized protein (DUF2236 family)